MNKKLKLEMIQTKWKWICPQCDYPNYFRMNMQSKDPIVEVIRCVKCRVLYTTGFGEEEENENVEFINS